MKILELTEYKYDISELVWKKEDDFHVRLFSYYYVESVIVKNYEYEWYMDICISGRRRYITLTNLNNEDDELKLDFSDRLFAPSINKYRGAISIDGLTILIDDNWDFNHFLLCIKHADELFEKGLCEKVVPVNCAKYIPESQYRISTFFDQYFKSNEPEYFFLYGVTFVTYDEYNDSYFHGNGDLMFYILNCKTNKETTLLDMCNNPDDCLICGEIFDAEIYFKNVKTEKTQYKCVLYSDTKPFIGGDSNTNTIYWFKDGKRVDGFEFRCNSLKNFNLLGEWLYTILNYKVNESFEISKKEILISEDVNEIVAEDPFKELEQLIGLSTIKKDVEELISFVKVQKMRNEKGIKSVPVSLHLVFTGNPGTGKTTVARILGKLYKDIGILTKGQLVEVDRSGLVAGYVGQTAIKTQEKINEALGGILFIDEAYTLAKDGNDFGQEAIDTILKAMEDYRDQIIVIVAGYAEPMSRFINSNPGLKSRFNKYINFDDYNEDELYQIFNTLCKEYTYKIEDNAEKHVREYLEYIIKNKNEDFANARDIRNMFESIITNQAARIFKINNLDDKDMMMITLEDVKPYIIQI